MMKNGKTVLSLLLVLVLAISVVGCGKGKDTASTNDNGEINSSGVNDDFFTDTEVNYSSQSTGNNSGTSSVKTSKNNEIPKENKIGGKSWSEVLASMPKELRGTTLTMYNWNPASEYTGAPAVIEEFQRQTGIKVVWNTINYDTYVTRLASLVASGDSPDLVRARTPIPSRLVSFQPLSTTGFDFSDKAWDQILMKDYTVNGVTYATSLKNTHLGSVGMMFYNKQLIDKYNFENPYTLWKNGKWTVSKFLNMCKQYKKEADANYACLGMLFDTWSQMHGVKGPVGYDGSKYYSLLNDSKFLTVTQEVADLFNQSKLFGEGRAEQFNESQALFYAGASVYARKKNSYFGTIKGAGAFYAVPFPSVDGQDKYYQIRDEYEAYAIAKGAKNAKAAPYFLRYFLDGENYELSTFFCNKQNLEVYNWCMNQENPIWTTYYESKLDTFGDRVNGIYSKQGSQIKSFIDSNASMIEQRIKEFNNTLNNLAK